MVDRTLFLLIWILQGPAHPLSNALYVYIHVHVHVHIRVRYTETCMSERVCDTEGGVLHAKLAHS